MQFLEFKLGDHLVNTDTHPVTYHVLNDKRLVLEFEDQDNPNASFRMELRHKPGRSLLKVDINARRIDLSDLAPYLTSGGEDGGVPDTVPFNFVLDDKYYAKDDLAADIKINKKRIKCSLHGGEKHKRGDRMMRSDYRH